MKFIHADKRILAQSGRGWFSILQGQSLSGASFTSLKQLQEHIDAYINTYNEKAEPFVWTKKKAVSANQRPPYHSALTLAMLLFASSHPALGDV